MDRNVHIQERGRVIPSTYIFIIHFNVCFPPFVASGGKPGSRTAKKGRKKLVLFSTGGMRGVN